MKIKFLEYNIQSGYGMDDRQDPVRTAEMIRRLDPDVCALLEVGANTNRIPNDIPAILKRELKMNVIYGEAFKPFGQGTYGVAALSRYPLELVEKIHLQLPDLPPEEAEPRVFLIVKVLAPEPFYLIVTHFPFQGEFPDDARYRLMAAQQITELVRTKNYLPALLAGDLNAKPDSEAVVFLHRDWDVVNDLDPETPTCYAEHEGWCQIDYVCAAPKGAFTAEKFTIEPDRTVSDHHPVTAELEFHSYAKESKK